MQALSIVVALDPVDDIQTGLSARFVENLIDSLDFRKHLAAAVVDAGAARDQSSAHHFRFDGHHCDRGGSQAG